MRNFLLFSLVLISCNQAPKKPADQSITFAREIRMDKKATVLYFLNTECPVCQKYQGDFKPVYKKFHTDFNFYYVFPGKQSEKDIRDFCDYDSIPYENILTDEAFNICKTYGAKTTPQVLIFSTAQEKNYLYTGKIDDRFESIQSHKAKAAINYIEKALISLQKNEAVEISKTDPVGCFIEPD